MPDSQRGALPILVILASLGLLTFLFITSSFEFKDRLFSELYPKEITEAAEIINKSTHQEFVSSKGLYKLSYDPSQWTLSKERDDYLGERVIFNLNKEYGYARLDVIEAKSEEDIDSFKDQTIEKSSFIPVSIEPLNFKDNLSYLIKYKEEILGEDTYFYKQIVKVNNKFFVFEKKFSSLGYSQPYLENLLEGISFTNEESSEQVKGVSDSQTELTTVQLVDLVKPSVVNIVHTYCLKIINLAPKLSGLSKPQYEFCGLSKGSGFVINDEGFIVTNGHVVKIYPEEALVNNLLYEGSKDFASDLIKGVYLAKGEKPSQNQIEDFYRQINSNPQYIDRFLGKFFEFLEKKAISIAINDERYYVNVGSKSVKIDYQKLRSGDYAGSITPSITTYAANLLDFDYPNQYSFDAIVNKNYQRGLDIGLLKIENTTSLFPAVELDGVASPREGSDVIVLGFPTLVEGVEDPRAAISYVTSTKPTITRGIISAVKQDLTGRTILQTDASFDHGTSGGPAFNSKGQVIGVATFMAESQSGNFNFLREVKEIEELLYRNKVDNNLGTLSAYWREGLNNFRNRRYTQAIKNFKKVKDLSPNHPTIDSFIKHSEKAVAVGNPINLIWQYIYTKLHS